MPGFFWLSVKHCKNFLVVCEFLCYYFGLDSPITKKHIKIYTPAPEEEKAPTPKSAIYRIHCTMYSIHRKRVGASLQNGFFWNQQKGSSSLFYVGVLLNIGDYIWNRYKGIYIYNKIKEVFFIKNRYIITERKDRGDLHYTH